jgi:S1-C subfamily serine protease
VLGSIRSTVPSRDVRAGAPVKVLGYARSGQENELRPTRTTGTVVGTDLRVRFDETLPAEPSMVEHQAPVPGGSAGGPLVNAEGKVLGINTDMAAYGSHPEVNRQLSYAIGSELVRGQLAELHAKPGQDFAGWKREHQCHYQFQNLVRKHRGTTMSHGGGSNESMEDHESVESGGGDHSGGGSDGKTYTGKKKHMSDDGM